jgi:hypothetical protein
MTRPCGGAGVALPLAINSASRPSSPGTEREILDGPITVAGRGAAALGPPAPTRRLASTVPTRIIDRRGSILAIAIDGTTGL